MATLVHIEDGVARVVEPSTWAREILPRLIEDARDDARALVELVEAALDHGVARAALPAVARLRALAADDVDIDVLAAAVRATLVDDRDVAPADVVGAPLVAPVWAAALAAAAPVVPSVEGKERALFFALHDATSSKLTRALPLAIAERLVGALAPGVVVPVVRGSGLYAASRPWALPEMIALSPVHERPRFLVGGTVTSERAELTTVALEVWDLHAGELVARPRASGTSDVVASLAKDVARACGVERVRVRRGKRPLFPEDASRAYVDALADVELALLAAHGVVPAASLVNLDVALTEGRALVTALGSAKSERASLGPSLTFIALVACASAAGLEVAREVREDAAAIAEELAREVPSLQPLAVATRGLARRG